jgi:hypothetical protein
MSKNLFIFTDRETLLGKGLMKIKHKKILRNEDGVVEIKRLKQGVMGSTKFHISKVCLTGGNQRIILVRG